MDGSATTLHSPCCLRFTDCFLQRWAAMRTETKKLLIILDFISTICLKALKLASIKSDQCFQTVASTATWDARCGCWRDAVPHTLPAVGEVTMGVPGLYSGMQSLRWRSKGIKGRCLLGVLSTLVLRVKAAQRTWENTPLKEEHSLAFVTSLVNLEPVFRSPEDLGRQGRVFGQHCLCQGVLGQSPA